ncbi:ATP-dependent Zn protease [Burkholderia sp. OAS925]
MPEHDNETYSKDYLLDRLAILFGGRVAEELFLNLISTGASDDFNKATQTARAMVARFGMTDALGPMVYVDDENDATPFGRGFTRTISEATQQKVDAEIRRVLDEQYNLAKRLLDENRDKVEAMTAALMEWETIDADQINDIMAGRPPRSPKSSPPSASDASSGGSPGTEVKPGSATAPA